MEQILRVFAHLNSKKLLYSVLCDLGTIERKQTILEQATAQFHGIVCALEK